MQITVLDDYQDAVRKLQCAQSLAGHDLKIFNNTVKGIGQLSVRLRDAQAVVLIRERTTLSRQLLEKCPKLRLVVQTGPLGPNVDLDACTELGIAVCEGDSDPAATAELTWALVMAATRRLPQYISSLKHGAWQQSGLKSQSMPPNFGLGQRLAGKTFGIWGFGRIGQRVAHYAAAFDMRVLVWGSERSRALAAERGYAAAPSRLSLFTDSDVLSLHLRSSDATRGLITLADLLQMKPTAVLVNTARPDLLAPDALVAALNRGRPGMAAVDVFETEPILQGQPLLRLENAICTPYIGFVEQEHYEHLFSQAFSTIAAFAAGDASRVVNPQALARSRPAPE